MTAFRTLASCACVCALCTGCASGAFQDQANRRASAPAAGTDAGDGTSSEPTAGSSTRAAERARAVPEPPSWGRHWTYHPGQQLYYGLHEGDVFVIKPDDEGKWRTTRLGPLSGAPSSAPEADPPPTDAPPRRGWMKPDPHTGALPPAEWGTNWTWNPVTRCWYGVQDGYVYALRRRDGRWERERLGKVGSPPRIKRPGERRPAEHYPPW